MRRVADAAGVTQGPRQYYFPTVTDLFKAVVDKIHDDANRSLERLLKSDAAAEDLARDLIGSAFRNCGSANHVAMIELKLACRGDDSLRAAIKDKIDAYETQADEDWIRLFSDIGLTRTELITLRAILASSLRGLGVALASGTAPGSRERICEMLTEIIIGKLQPSGRKA